MAFITYSAYDALLEYIRDNGNNLVLCSAEPTTYAEANATFALARATIAPADYTIAAGDVSGRKLTLDGQTTTGEDDGTATHYAVIDTASSELLLVNTMTNVAITNTEPQDTNPVRLVEVEDPA